VGQQERFPLAHIIETQQFSPEILEDLCLRADDLRRRPNPTCLRGKIMASLFYAPSTRTRFSFEAAMYNLGGHVLSTENAKEFSSAAKGESLDDTIHVVSRYAQVIVLRHDDTDAAKQAAMISKVPIINAGCGTGQHPTQALLDIYTIKRRRKVLTNLRIGLMGDLKNGRTVRSLAYLMGKFAGTKLHFISPQELAIDRDMRLHFKEHQVEYCEHDTSELEHLIDSLDVLYVTRVQTNLDKEALQHAGSYQLTHKIARKMKPDGIIMHPLPRTGELPTDIDGMKQAAYFEDQVECGLYMRMALLRELLKNPPEA